MLVDKIQWWEFSYEIFIDTVIARCLLQLNKVWIKNTQWKVHIVLNITLNKIIPNNFLYYLFIKKIPYLTFFSGSSLWKMISGSLPWHSLSIGSLGKLARKRMQKLSNSNIWIIMRWLCQSLRPTLGLSCTVHCCCAGDWAGTCS